MERRQLGEARHYVGGRWVAGDGAFLDVVDPATESVVGRAPAGGRHEIDAAVDAARAAQPAWEATPLVDRCVLVEALADALEARRPDAVSVIATEVGSPLGICDVVQVGMAVEALRTYAAAGRELELERTIANSLVVREAMGVAGCITPWNYPLYLAVCKVAPALVTGCTVVLKPSELTPFAACLLVELAEAVGLPPGVLNVVHGTGPEAGERLAAHPDVAIVSFTGSTAAGRRVGSVAADTVKRVALELGGKSPTVLCDDADFERAVPNAVTMCFLNSGQTCTALGRLLVPRERLPEVEALAVAAAERHTVGDPFDPKTRLGPVISATQRARVRAYIEGAVDEGGKLLTGGASAPDGVERGYYVRPTVVSGVTPDMTIAQEEVFGPVIALMAYDDDDHAVELANATIYGLSAAVWSADEDRALGMARRIKAGQVNVNGGRFNPRAPFGGYRQSGIGRELGTWGLEEYLEVKAIQR